MPLSRHTVRSEYALGGSDLYRAADQHDPEAVLDGVAMAGLVGVLRQLGDLAEFAAQVFHGLYDEVMSTSARGHGLMLRVQQLEAELPLLEKDSWQRDYLYVASNRGVDWHSNPRVDHGVVTRGDTPRFIMDSIKQCRGPPKLFMLDKYDVGGEGACLKRYTDPSFFKTDSACSTLLQEGIQNERRPLKAMEIRPNLQNAEICRPLNAADNVFKLETDLSGEAMDEVPTNRRRLKYRQLNGSVFQSFRPLMQNLYEKPSSEEKLVTVDHSKVHISMNDSPESDTEERDIMVDTSVNMEKGTFRKNISISEEARSSDTRSAGSSKGYNSEFDIYMDALTTMDSEVETESEHRGHGQCTFDRMDSDNRFSNVQYTMASRTSSFEKKDKSDVASANRDTSNQHEETIVSTQHTKPVVGEHERTSSLEELLDQEKPASWDHERTSSLEEVLTEDFNVPESGVREQATEEQSCNGSITSVVSNGTQDITKKTKEVKENSNIATISFKKIASKRSKYVGSMELIASKVGILPRKLSKKHDPFSDSLRYMAKQLLELKYDGTQDRDLYDFEANGVGCDVKYQEIYDPPVEIKESDVHKIPSDSPYDDVDSRKCLQEEVNHELEHDVPPTDSPHDSVPDEGNGFQDSNMYLAGIITSCSSQEEEGCASAALDENSSTGVISHILEHAQEKFEEHLDKEVNEDIHTEVICENASDKCEDLKEVSIYVEQVHVEDFEESNKFDVYVLDDETDEYIEEQVVSDGMISSPVSSKQSDDTCCITPLTLADEDDTVACKIIDSPEVEHSTLSETFTDIDLPNVVITESVINTEHAMADNEQCYLHPKTAFGQDPILGSNEIIGNNEQVQLCSSTTVAKTPELPVNTEEKHEFHQAVHQEPSNSLNSSTEVFGDPPPPDSRDAPPSVISSFDWMLNGAMQQSFNILPSHPTNVNAQENGSSEDVPPLPPLPPMQWLTNKLQTGSSPLYEKIGRPPRPKPPVKQQESEAAWVLQEKSLHKGLSLQNEVVQSTISNDHEINPTLNMDFHENHHQEGEEYGCEKKEGEDYDAQDSNPFPSSEVECLSEVASVKSENLHTLQLPELIVVPEEAWSVFGNIKFIPEEQGKHQLSIGLSVCNGLYTSDSSAQKASQKPEIFADYKEKEFSAAGNDKVADSEENRPNVAIEQNGMLNPDLPAQQKNDEHDCDDKAREFSSALEEESSKSPTHAVPKPPRYPLLPVTSHDRSMLRKAPTLVQHSSQLSDEQNTLLEQIKNKSFNLKPVLAKRPNVMGGPKTNLQVVAILERAHAIRQAVADDDDEDTWSE